MLTKRLCVHLTGMKQAFQLWLQKLPDSTETIYVARIHQCRASFIMTAFCYSPHRKNLSTCLGTHTTVCLALCPALQVKTGRDQSSACFWLNSLAPSLLQCIGRNTARPSLTQPMACLLHTCHSRLLVISHHFCSRHTSSGSVCS